VSTQPHFETEPSRLAQPFPADFSWGFAASAYQIEGAAAEDGRGPSIWDTFARSRARIADGSNGDVACDHYHRYADDVQSDGRSGARAYRFSVSWPRCCRWARAASISAGIDFYQRLVDALLGARGPAADQPVPLGPAAGLQDRAASPTREVVGWFTTTPP
jgi:beta-glucosidase